MTVTVTVPELNKLSSQQAASWFEQACAAQGWIEQMVNTRPYKSVSEITEYARTAWANCTREDYLEAFSAHPMIGDVDSLREKFANTKAIASNEQAGTANASEQTLLALKEANHAYLDRHGFIFIICASGLSADAMLAALQARIENSTDEEIKNAAAEQIKITLLRLNKALQE